MIVDCRLSRPSIEFNFWRQRMVTRQDPKKKTKWYQRLPLYRSPLQGLLGPNNFPSPNCIIASPSLYLQALFHLRLKVRLFSSWICLFRNHYTLRISFHAFTIITVSASVSVFRKQHCAVVLSFFTSFVPSFYTPYHRFLTLKSYLGRHNLWEFFIGTNFLSPSRCSKMEKKNRLYNNNNQILPKGLTTDRIEPYFLKLRAWWRTGNYSKKF